MILPALKRHPFAVEAYFDYSLVLTYSAPAQRLAHLLPAPLELDLHKDETAFLAVAMVQTRGLRAKGWPRWLGQAFFLLGYRLFVRYHTAAGKRLRGLYILRSETDKPRMAWAGNLFTHYHYREVGIEAQANKGRFAIQSSLGLNVQATLGTTESPLPVGSPFESWKEARRFAGPMPFTFTYEPLHKKMVIIEGVRQHWQPQPVVVQHSYVPFLAELGLESLLLANAFCVQGIPYYWKKGRTEPWPHTQA